MASIGGMKVGGAMRAEYALEGCRREARRSARPIPRTTISWPWLSPTEDAEYSCPAGSFIYIPAGLRHGFRVGDVPSRKLNIYVPSAMVGYFDELSEALRSGRMEPDALDAMALRYGMEVTGPVPDGYV